MIISQHIHTRDSTLFDEVFVPPASEAQARSVSSKRTRSKFIGLGIGSKSQRFIEQNRSRQNNANFSEFMQQMQSSPFTKADSAAGGVVKISDISHSD